ncbi:hypothetical protein [Woodsholea maritima]|uniref:hypothetical protein n=1 Tax=Woodsholea maritima TaxID=240237 RepID=UPI0012E9F2BC|nr:hypothetical protein [Woodsholea maritima]
MSLLAELADCSFIWLTSSVATGEAIRLPWFRVSAIIILLLVGYGAVIIFREQIKGILKNLTRESPVLDYGFDVVTKSVHPEVTVSTVNIDQKKFLVIASKTSFEVIVLDE